MFPYYQVIIGPACYVDTRKRWLARRWELIRRVVPVRLPQLRSSGDQKVEYKWYSALVSCIYTLRMLTTEG